MKRLLFDRRAKLICATLWGVAWIGAAAALLLPLGLPTPGRTDLVAHFLLFGGLAFGAVGFTRRAGQLGWLTLTTIALSVALEFAQRLFPYRTFDPVDMVANSIGALMGCSAALLVLYLVIRPTELRWKGVAP
jgi:VanZ family protein